MKVKVTRTWTEERAAAEDEEEGMLEREGKGCRGNDKDVAVSLQM